MDVIKMDVEGVEPWVFAGMKKTIEANPELHIVIEYTPSNYDNAKAFTDYLFSGFEIQQIKGVEDLVKLESSDIPQLLQLDGHIDLYLRPKANTSE